MKFLKLFLFLLIYTDINSQTSAYDNLRKLFLDYDFTNKPKQIEERTERALIDYSPGVYYPYEPAIEKNISSFTQHPLIKSKFEKGNYNVVYKNDEKYYNQTGQYKIYINIFFKGANALIDSQKEYSRLVDLFKLDSFKNSEEYHHDGTSSPQNRSVVVYYSKVYTLPKLELNFTRLDESESYKLEFIYTTTWSFKKFKSFVPKF